MRAVDPIYNNNEEIRYENKIKNKKNHKNDIYKE
jgi:hypothetical protein